LTERDIKTKDIPVAALVDQEVVVGEAETLVALKRDTGRSPLPPSPLGVSNYDALDDWHGYDEEDDDPCQSHFPAPDKSYYPVDSAYKPNAKTDEVYSDFNFFDPDSNIPDDDDFDDPFAVLPPELLKINSLPTLKDEPFIKAMKEEERSRGLMFYKVA